MYVNLKCRKCGQYVSKKVNSRYYPQFGYILDKTAHNCPNGIADDEKIFCDLISKSDNPIGETIE